MMTMSLPRICCGLALLVSLLAFPFWVTVVLAIAGYALFPRYAEAVVGAILLELWHGGGDSVIFPTGGLTLIALLILFIADRVRMFIRERA